MVPSVTLGASIELGARDCGEVAGLFATAFVDDPFAIAVGPNHPGLRRRLLTLEYKLETSAIRRAGGRVFGVRDRGGRLVGALTADEGPVAVTKHPTRGELIMGLAGPWVMRRAMIGERALVRARPATAHLYIVKVAVVADQRGTGIGRALIGRVLSAAQARGLPVLLDTMTQENVEYYKHLGFQTTQRLALPRGLNAWLMARPA